MTRARAEIARPFANTETAKFIDERIERLKGVKSQREIALAIGYDKPNVLSMIKHGDVKLPLDKIPALADAIEVDPAHLLRMAVHDYLPKLEKAFEQVIGYVATKNEHELLLKPWRAATADADPAPTAELAAALGRFLREIQIGGADREIEYQT